MSLFKLISKLTPQVSQPLAKFNKIPLCQFQTFSKMLSDDATNLKPSFPYTKPTQDNNESSTSMEIILAPADFSQYRYSGRSVVTTEDPMRAYYRLNGILKANNVRKELARHRYYEKPCLKRRRLKMESNRRRFKELVATKVAQVMQLKNRGV